MFFLPLSASLFLSLSACVPLIYRSLALSLCLSSLPVSLSPPLSAFAHSPSLFLSMSYGLSRIKKPLYLPLSLSLFLCAINSISLFGSILVLLFECVTMFLSRSLYRSHSYFFCLDNLCFYFCFSQLFLHFSVSDYISRNIIFPFPSVYVSHFSPPLPQSLFPFLLFFVLSLFLLSLSVSVSLSSLFAPFSLLSFTLLTSFSFLVLILRF